MEIYRRIPLNLSSSNSFTVKFTLFSGSIPLDHRYYHSWRLYVHSHAIFWASEVQVHLIQSKFGIANCKNPKRAELNWWLFWENGRWKPHWCSKRKWLEEIKFPISSYFIPIFEDHSWSELHPLSELHPRLQRQGSELVVERKSRSALERSSKFIDCGTRRFPRDIFGGFQKKPYGAHLWYIYIYWPSLCLHCTWWFWKGQMLVIVGYLYPQLMVNITNVDGKDPP